MSKSVIFDAGPIISLTTNNLLWIIEKLKERYSGDFLIPKSVEFELVQKPIETKKFKLEALEVNMEINKGNLKVIDNPEITALKQELLLMANSCFKANGKQIQIVQDGEMAAVAVALLFESDAIVIDERTTRELIENPEELAELMSRKLHTKVEVDKEILKKLNEKLGKLKVIRSVELAVVGYELGLFDKYLTKDKDARKTLKEAILWGIKIRGASISQEEIDKIVRMEK